MSQTIKPKGMTLGEGGLALFFAALAFASIMAAGKADDAPFAFHAFLAAAASAASVFAIVNRYYSRPIDLPPKEIDGKPNYHMHSPNRCRFCCGA